MKKQSILLFWLLMVSTFLLASCKQRQEMESPQTPSNKASDKVYLTVTSRLPSVRTIYLVDKNKDGKVQINWEEGDKITASAIVVNQKDLSHLQKVPLSGVVQKDKNENYTVTFSLNTPMKIAPQTLSSGQWFIKILFYLQDNHNLPANSAIHTNIAYTNPTKINVPIACSWTKLSVQQKNGRNTLESPSPVLFSPIGSIISFTFQPIQNSISACDSLVFLTDAFSTTDSISLPDKLITFNPNNNSIWEIGVQQEKPNSLKLSEPYAGASSNNTRYYFWCMPTPSGGTHLQAQLFTKGDKSPSYTTNDIKKNPLLSKSDMSYSILFTILMPMPTPKPTPTEDLIPVRLHTNFGIDERVIIYVPKNKAISTSELTSDINTYTDKWNVVVRGWSDTPQDIWDSSPAQYTNNQEITITKPTDLFAVCTVDEKNPTPSKFRNTDVYAKGITPPTINQWKPIRDGRPGDKTVPWTKGCGWYHTYQYTDNMCWAATTSNIVLWWMDQNKDNINKYNQILGKSFVEHYNETHPDLAPKMKPSYMEYGNSMTCGVYQHIFKTYFENQDGHASNAFPWFICGFKLKDNGIITGLKPEYNKQSSGGFFRDIFHDKQTIPIREINYFRKGSFNIFISQALEKGYALSFETSGHAWNIWGGHFDSKGFVDSLYVTDSRTNTLSYTIDGQEDGLEIIPIIYQKNNDGIEYPRLKMSIGTTGIYKVSCYPLGQQEWKDYFKNHTTTTK